MKKTMKTASALVLLTIAGIANAGTANDNMNITVNIGASCELMPRGDHNLRVFAGSSTASQANVYSVRCNAALPYTLAINGTTEGGKLDVTDAVTNRTYQVLFKQTATNTPWGTKGNGEEYAGVGSGLWDTLPYRITFNQDFGYGVPQVGTYKGVITRSLEWAP